VRHDQNRAICRHCGNHAPQGLFVHGTCQDAAVYADLLTTARRRTDASLKRRGNDNVSPLSTRAAQRVLNERKLWKLTQEART